MTKTQAIKVARTAVGRIYSQSSTDYVFYAPYYATEISGPTTGHRADCYYKARAQRTIVVARIALAQLGIEAGYEATYGGTTVEQLVSAGIRAAD